MTTLQYSYTVHTPKYIIQYILMMIYSIQVLIKYIVPTVAILLHVCIKVVATVATLIHNFLFVNSCGLKSFIHYENNAVTKVST